jgi:hypothetical protein
MKMAVIALMMETVRTSETSIIIYQTTWFNIPGDSHVHTCYYGNANLGTLPCYMMMA